MWMRTQSIPASYPSLARRSWTILISALRARKPLVPEDGIILPATEVTFSDGESVYDVLQRVCKANKIHMESSFTPVYNSAYIEGIHNLYEFDVGEALRLNVCRQRMVS